VTLVQQEEREQLDHRVYLDLQRIRVQQRIPDRQVQPANLAQLHQREQPEELDQQDQRDQPDYLELLQTPVQLVILDGQEEVVLQG
jgi:hypothetical protein